jgi:arginyl-tRNA synthetase
MSTHVLEELKNEVATWLVNNLPVNVPKETVFDALDTSKNDVFGDCCLPLPKLRIPGSNPKALGAELESKFKPCGNLLRIEQKDAFLNFSWNRGYLLQKLIPAILSQNEKYGTNSSGEGKTVLVEHGSPNIAKPFHAGHLRSSVIGNFVKQVYRANGYNVVGINYLGDWGKQYGLLAVGYGKYGNEAEFEKDPIRHLFDVYVQINKDAEADPTIHDQARAYFKRMEDGDREALVLWQRFRDLSIEKYKQTFKRLNIDYEVYSGESLYEKGMKVILNELKEKSLLTESQNAQIIDLKQYGLDIAVVLKSDGASLYLTRDLAAAKGRYDEYHFSKSIYVISSQQDHYLKQLYKILDLMGYSWAKDCSHINYGMVKGMSTRKGTVAFLEDILDEAKRVMHEVMKSNQSKYEQIEDPEKTADILGVSAVVIQDFSARRIKDYEFKMDRMTSFEGDTGPYLQYAHVRLCSIERKYSNSNADGSVSLDFASIKYDLLKEDCALHLATLLARYPEVVSDACRTAEPCLVVTYLMNLCHHVSTVLEQLYVIGQAPDLANARLALYIAARTTLGNGLRLLGLVPLEKM